MVSRFRKRDTIAFMGNKMVKKVKAAGSYIRFGLTFKIQKVLWRRIFIFSRGGKGQKRRAIAKLARRFLGQQGRCVLMIHNDS